MGRPTRIRASNWPIGGSDWPVGGSRTVNRRYWRTGGTRSSDGQELLPGRVGKLRRRGSKLGLSQGETTKGVPGVVKNRIGGCSEMM
jgi:hypothetical protein